MTVPPNRTLEDAATMVPFVLAVDVELLQRTIIDLDSGMTKSS